MSEKFVRIGSYNHAVANHREYALTIAATGLFDSSDRVADEYDLRERVQAFLVNHTDTQPQRVTPITEELVPLQESFAEACVEGLMGSALSGKLAAKALLHYGVDGRFDEFDKVYRAYRATLEVMDVSQRIVAQTQLGKTATRDTPQYSDRLSVCPETEAATRYAQTLRRMLARSVLSEEVYVRRMEETNMRPIPALMRKLRTL